MSSSTNDVIWLAVPRNRSDPFLVEWDYVDANPIIVTDARDPTELFKTAWGAWRMAVGTDHGTVLWEAANLTSVMRRDGWHELGPLAPPDPGLEYYECPDFFELPMSHHRGKPLWVHKWSAVGLRGDWWQAGTYDEQQGAFQPLVDPRTGIEKQATLIDGNLHYYAAKTFLDNKGCDLRVPREGTKLSKLEQRGKLRSGVTRASRKPRRILWAWFHGPSGVASVSGLRKIVRIGDTNTWQSALGVPRIVEAAPDGVSIVSYPIPELSKLRDNGPTTSLKVINLPVVHPLVPLSFHGDMLDIEASIRFTVSAAAFQARDIACGFRVLWRKQPGDDNSLVDGKDTYVEVLAEMTFGDDGRPTAKSLIVAEVSVLSSSNDAERSVGTRVNRHDVPLSRTLATSVVDEASRTMSLRILVDRSIVEAFANGGMTTASVYHPSSPFSGATLPAAGVAAVSRQSSEGVSCEIESLDVWHMRPFSYSTNRCENRGAHANCL